MITITFEDQGQDFLVWDVENDGEVVGCMPFQHWHWAGSMVLNLDALELGDLVWIKRKKETFFIKYPVVDIQNTEVN